MARDAERSINVREGGFIIYDPLSNALQRYQKHLLEARINFNSFRRK